MKRIISLNLFRLDEDSLKAVDLLKMKSEEWN